MTYPATTSERKKLGPPQKLRVQIPIHAAPGLGYGQIVTSRENLKTRGNDHIYETTFNRRID
jgi:hypothetical protein